METIERILGHEIPILPEPFLPESELRPLTEADYQRLFEEFCAAPISTLPPEFWTETTTDKPVSITPAEETQAATPQRPRRHHLTDQEKSITALKGERYVSISAAARILHVARPTIYAMIDRGDLQLIKLGPRTNRIDLQGITDQRNSFPPAKIPKKKLEEMLKDDKLYLDAEQCLKYGICDEIT